MSENITSVRTMIIAACTITTLKNEFLKGNITKCSRLPSTLRIIDDFLYYCQIWTYLFGQSLSLSFLQHLKRTGWVNHAVTDPETVSGHMYRMAMMAFLAGKEGRQSVSQEKFVNIYHIILLI